MPIIDRREIQFDAKVLISAITASLRTVDLIGLPPLPPVGLRLYPDENIVEFAYNDEEQATVRVAATKLGAFLVTYCVRARIPMPRFADKSVRVEADLVFLSFKTYYAEAPAADVGAGSISFCRK